MSLSNAVNATLGDREGRATINDNDGTDPPVGTDWTSAT